MLHNFRNGMTEKFMYHKEFACSYVLAQTNNVEDVKEFFG